MTSLPLLETKNLTKIYTVHRKQLIALRSINLSIERGKTFGLVGESGCGKSTLGKTILRLTEPTSGTILFKGQDITQFTNQKMKRLRKSMQMIFQDPFASLNPRMTVESIISEPLVIHEILSKDERRKRVLELLDLVNLPQNALSRFPHEFSGGQRQRIGIARALTLNPEFIVCDEPISALDISIQAQIVNLLLSLQKELQLTYLFIAHDLAMVKILSSHIAVMYLGEFVEMGPADAIFHHPVHPYTQILISSISRNDKSDQAKPMILQGEPPSPFSPPKGCAFCTRCPSAKTICFEQKPLLQKNENEHFVACFLNEH